MQSLKAYSYLFITAMLLGTFPGNQEASAHETGYWGTTANKAWKSGFGECWNTGFPGGQGLDCGDAPPATPATEPDTSGYFWLDDQDGDGVVDRDDACPFTPEGVAVDSRGCALDEDGDGVPDYRDQCPGTAAGNVVDTNGCSLALVKLKGIHFDFDSADLTTEAISILDRSLAAIRSSSSQNLSVEGHTDSTGTDSYNLNLSQRRAEAVVDYLVGHGIDRSRLSARGFGESAPISTNDSAAGRAQNRRVEIYAR